MRELALGDRLFSAFVGLLYWIIPKILSRYAPHIFFSVVAFMLIFVATRSIELAFEWFKIVWMIFGLAEMTPAGLIGRKIFQDIM